MIRHRIGRIATISSVVALLASTVLAGGAIAANNRIVYFGTPEAQGSSGGTSTGTPIVYGTLAGETKVTAGGRTAVTVLLKNNDNQTLNHARFSGGTNADAKPDNPVNQTPAGTSLPTGATVDAVFSSSSLTTCSALPATGVDCELGQLSAGASVTLTVVIGVPATKGDYGYWLTGSWNEGWSSTGSNADYNFATGTLKVLESNCGNGQASYFLGSENVVLGDGGDTCQSQNAEIKSGNALGGNGGFAQVAIDSTSIACPAGFKCFGKPVSVSILGGLPVPGGVEWTVTWFGTKTIKGVLHLGDNYPADPANFTAIALTRQNQCSATKLTDCWKSVTTTTKPTQSVTVVFVTDSNGRGLGF